LTILRNFQLKYRPTTFHAEADAWRAIIDLNLVHSIIFLLRLLDEDGMVASAAKTSTPVTRSSSSGSGSGSGVASFSVGFAGADNDDSARPLLPSSPKLMPLRWLHVGFLLLHNIKSLERIVSPDTPWHLGGGSSGGAGAGAGGMSSRLVKSICCMTGGIWSMPK
jgi:hypothetical protein